MSVFIFVFKSCLQSSSFLLTEIFNLICDSCIDKCIVTVRISYCLYPYKQGKFLCFINFIPPTELQNLREGYYLKIYLLQKIHNCQSLYGRSEGGQCSAEVHKPVILAHLLEVPLQLQFSQNCKSKNVKFCYLVYPPIVKLNFDTKLLLCKI